MKTRERGEGGEVLHGGFWLANRREQRPGLPRRRHLQRRRVGGGIWPAPPKAPSFVQLFIEVEDVAAAEPEAG